MGRLSKFIFSCIVVFFVCSIARMINPGCWMFLKKVSVMKNKNEKSVVVCIRKRIINVAPKLHKRMAFTVHRTVSLGRKRIVRPLSACRQVCRQERQGCIPPECRVRGVFDVSTPLVYLRYFQYDIFQAD
jgi:hypothetical protein